MQSPRPEIPGANPAHARSCITATCVLTLLSKMHLFTFQQVITSCCPLLTNCKPIPSTPHKLLPRCTSVSSVIFSFFQPKHLSTFNASFCTHSRSRTWANPSPHCISGKKKRNHSQFSNKKELKHWRGRRSGSYDAVLGGRDSRAELAWEETRASKTWWVRVKQRRHFSLFFFFFCSFFLLTFSELVIYIYIYNYMNIAI